MSIDSIYGLTRNTTLFSTVNPESEPVSHQGRSLVATDNVTCHLNPGQPYGANTTLGTPNSLSQTLNGRACRFTLGTTVFLLLSSAATALTPATEIPPTTTRSPHPYQYHPGLPWLILGVVGCLGVCLIGGYAYDKIRERFISPPMIEPVAAMPGNEPAQSKNEIPPSYSMVAGVDHDSPSSPSSQYDAVIQNQKTYTYHPVPTSDSSYDRVTTV